MSCMLKANHPRAAMSEHHIISQIVNVGETHHPAGCPPFKLEKYVEHYARNRGIEVMALASANWINFQFNDEDNTVVIKRLKPPSIDLTLLAQTINRITRDDESIALEFIAPLLVGLMPEYANSLGLNVPAWTLCIASILLFVPGISIANALE